MKSLEVVALLCVCVVSYGLKLPRYIKPCAINDPDFNECARKSAMEAIPHFIHGDPKYKVPPLEPMLITELVVAQGTRSVGMELIAKNASLHGLSKVKITATRFDFDKQHIEYDWYFPQLDIDLMYTASGRVLLLPIQGRGPGLMSFKNVTAIYSYDYNFIKKKDNKRYMVPNNAHLTFDAKGLHMKLENLFNGDKFLGDNMNRFLNENWDEILKDVGPAIGHSMAEYIRQILTNIFTLVPFDEAIPPSS